ncbi:MAG: hypothetical protein U0586_04940, partial [Candidatus Brocadiaceae bacterium]
MRHSRIKQSICLLIMVFILVLIGNSAKAQHEITICKDHYFQKGMGLSSKATLPHRLLDTPTPYAWKMLVIVYPRIDASYIWKGKTYYLQHEMNYSDRSFFLQTINRIPDTVYSWAGGNTQIKLTVVISDRPIQSVTVTNEGTNDEKANWWISPDDVRSEMDTYAPPGTYDSIIAVFNLVEGSIWGVGSVGTWGSVTNGAGYAMVQLPINFQAWGSTYPEEIIVHEWLHTVEGFYRGFGYAVPSLHDAEKYGYKPDGNGSWHRWYEDYMQNKVWNGTKYVGVPSDAWENHIPTGLVYVSAPALPKAISPVNSSREISPDPAFSWQSVPDALWYRLQVSDNSLFSTTLIDRWISKTFYPAIAFVNNTNYYWRLKAMNAAGASNWSKKGHFTTVLDNWMPNDG